MTREEVEATIREVLTTVLRRRVAPGENVRRGTEASWDSLKHVELVFAIEGALGLQFGPEELGEMDSLEKLVASAERHLAG